MKLRATVEAAGQVVRFDDIHDTAGWAKLTAWLATALRFEQLDAGRCASAVVAVHFVDERCDHE